MTDNRIDGTAKVVLGKFESAAGEALGDRKMQANGAIHQATGHFQEAAGVAQDAVERARAAAAKVGEAYDRVSDVARRVDPFVQEQPYAAIGLAALAGLLVGLLMANRRPRVVYVKPRT